MGAKNFSTVDRRTFLQLGLFATAFAALAACGGEKRGSNTDTNGRVRLTVWGPQEDQSNKMGRWLQTECETFAAAHPEWDLAFKYGVMSEGDASQALVSDPSAGADVYLFSNNQIPELVKAIAIAELGGTRVDAIKAANTESCVNTVTYEGGIYGVPFTGNTWFMYYDKSVFTPEDILSLDAMLTKAKVAFPLENSWYLAAFYVAGGCTLFGPDGDDEEAGIDFGGDKAVAVTNYLVDLVGNPNFANGDVGDNPGAKAFFSGSWDFEKAHDAYGDNLGIAAAPSINLGGEMRQLKAFAGSKVIGCNPSTENYRKHPEIVVELAMHLGGAEAQRRHYELRDIIPSDVNVAVDDELARAQMDAMDYASIVQPLQPNMSNYWVPADSMGQELVVRTVTHENAEAKTMAMNKAFNSFVTD